MTLLPGGSLPGVTAGLRTLCSVRTAGTAITPMAYLANVDWSFGSFTPDPYATNGSAGHVSATTNFEVAFSAPVQGAGPENFSVQGLQSGPALAGQTYSGNGTSTIATPSGNFVPSPRRLATASRRARPRAPSVQTARTVQAPRRSPS